MFKNAYKLIPNSLRTKVIKSIIDLKMNEFMKQRWIQIKKNSQVEPDEKKSKYEILNTLLGFEISNIINMFKQKPEYLIVDKGFRNTEKVKEFCESQYTSDFNQLQNGKRKNKHKLHESKLVENPNVP